jgi:hypothetical protein
MAEDKELDAIRDEVARVLTDPAWEVAYNTDTNPSYFSLRVHHPLTSHVNVVFRRGDPSNRARLTSLLRSREVTLIASAPSQREIIGSVRCNAEIGEWPDSVLQQVATILYSHEIISRGEWQWLQEAGAVDWESDLLGNAESGE